MQVKLNQKHLLEHCQRVSNNWNPNQTHATFEKERNRIEKREILIYWNTSYLPKSFSDLVKVIIRVNRTTKIFDGRAWIRSYEESYYISTILLSPREFQSAIRGHWGIENRSNHVRDCSLGEDASRIRVKAGIMGTCRSIALNIMRVNGKENIASEVYQNCLNIQRLTKYRFLGF